MLLKCNSEAQTTSQMHATDLLPP